MTIFAGLDVSDKATHICAVTSEGRVVRRDAVATDPEVLAKWLKGHCPGLVRVVRLSRQYRNRSAKPDDLVATVEAQPRR